jgi:hypothetical protein
MKTKLVCLMLFFFMVSARVIFSGDAIEGQNGPWITCSYWNNTLRGGEKTVFLEGYRSGLVAAATAYGSAKREYLLTATPQELTKHFEVTEIIYRDTWPTDYSIKSVITELDTNCADKQNKDRVLAGLIRQIADQKKRGFK